MDKELTVGVDEFSLVFFYPIDGVSCPIDQVKIIASL